MKIQAGNYTLRSFTLDDTAQYYGITNGDPKVKLYVPFAYPHNMKEATENANVYACGDGINDFYLVVEYHKEVVGLIIAVRTIGMILDTSIIMSEKYRGHGIMKTALNAFTEWLKENTEYDALSLVVKDGNISSNRLVHKCGAVFDAQLDGYTAYKIVL